MEAGANQNWFLRKHQDGAVFGPLTFDQLSRWASTARIAPGDALSVDKQTWVKAPMLPELGMDWLVEVTSEHYYGPTTLGAIQEFIRLGEINEDTFLINSCDGMRRQIRQLPALLHLGRQNSTATMPMENSGEPLAHGISLDLQKRIADLEQALGEERRALEESEQRYAELEQKYQELLRNSTS